jgi:hypothetical protein
MDFVKDNLVWVLLGVVVIAAVIAFIKSVVRWILTAVIIIGFLIYGLNYTPLSFKPMADELVTNTRNTIEDKAVAKLMSLTDLTYTQDKKGNYSVSGGGINLSGNVASKSGTVTVSGQSFTVPITTVIDSFLATQKKMHDIP